MLADPPGASRLYALAADRATRLGRPVLASTTRSTSPRDPIAFFAEAQAEDRALWFRPASGEAKVGLGSADTLTGRGPERFGQVARAWQALLADAVVDRADSTKEAGPVLLGGFSFDPARRPTRLWAGFPDARLLLPEQVLSTGNGAATLTTNVLVGPLDSRASPPDSRSLAPAARGLDPEAWQALVRSVADSLRQASPEVGKVVLARARVVHPRRSIAAALRTLAAEYPTCTIFAFAHRDACFLGATPERLIELRGGAATTMALAGSAPRGATPAEDARLAEHLMRDPKERAEHAVVVAALRDSLAEVCTRVVADAEPRLRRLSNVQHLFTPVRGQLPGGRSVLDLVERLHPTPAVGGFPRERALAIIRQHEALDRGWYAAPFGWVGADGQGEFVVGLRSALVRGETATLFAGCGIVAQSNPVTELAEWGWKLRPMLAALGVES